MQKSHLSTETNIINHCWELGHCVNCFEHIILNNQHDNAVS
ncbi:hypothetical protein VULLAG_LOCUS3470 [Vulpes lagopus]